jgi:hypothetical protein
MNPPSSELINALPEEVRRYIEHLEDLVSRIGHQAGLNTDAPATLEELEEQGEDVADSKALGDSWECLTCHERYFFDEAVENPGSCGQCGGIGFKAIQRPMQ